MDEDLFCTLELRGVLLEALELERGVVTAEDEYFFTPVSGLRTVARLVLEERLGVDFTVRLDDRLVPDVYFFAVWELDLVVAERLVPGS